MTRIGIEFEPCAVAGGAGDGKLCYLVCRGRSVRRIDSGVRLFGHEWDERTHAVDPARAASEGRRRALRELHEGLAWGTKRLEAIVRRLERLQPGYALDEVVRRYEAGDEEFSLFGFMNSVIRRLKEMGKIRTAGHYRDTLRSFAAFRGGKDIPLEELDADLMQGYEAFLRGRGVVRNTSSYYMRVLRAVYNRARERELVESRNPFRNVYTGVDKTVKRALSLEAVKRLKELDLAHAPKLEFARDMFLFSFYTRGMSFVDMAYLKKRDLDNGVLAYRRQKTGQLLLIRWEACMQEILDKHQPSRQSPYLLPILAHPCGDTNARYRYVMAGVNRWLKKVADLAGIPVALSLYCARHSWASAAKDKNIPISVISEGMGHDSESTTRIYLASLDRSVVDRANASILDAL